MHDTEVIAGMTSSCAGMTSSSLIVMQYPDPPASNLGHSRCTVPQAPQCSAVVLSSPMGGTDTSQRVYLVATHAFDGCNTRIFMTTDERTAVQLCPNAAQEGPQLHILGRLGIAVAMLRSTPTPAQLLELTTYQTILQGCQAWCLCSLAPATRISGQDQGMVPGLSYTKSAHSYALTQKNA